MNEPTAELVHRDADEERLVNALVAASRSMINKLSRRDGANRESYVLRATELLARLADEQHAEESKQPTRSLR